MVMELINANPVIHEKKERRVREAPENIDENAAEVIDQLDIFDHIRDIKDPEHPYSLEDLNVVTEDSVDISDELSHGYFHPNSGALQYGHYHWPLPTCEAHAESSSSLQGGHKGGSWITCN